MNLRAETLLWTAIFVLAIALVLTTMQTSGIIQKLDTRVTNIELAK